MSEELKPCPFCGGKPDYHKSIDRYYWAICHNCGSNIADKKSGETIKLWNHRPEEERLQKRIEELEECLRLCCVAVNDTDKCGNKKNAKLAKFI